MLQGSYDPYSSEELAQASSPYMHAKMQHTNLYCRRHRTENKDSISTNRLKQLAEGVWNTTYRGGSSKKRKINSTTKEALDAYMEHLTSGTFMYVFFF